MPRPFIQGNTAWLASTVLLSLFEDLEVRNYETRYGDTYTKRLKVDVTLDTKEKVQLKLLAGGHRKLEQADTRLPRISVQLNSITPDIQRYTGKNASRVLERRISGVETGGHYLTTDLQPYPVTMEYSVSIWCKYFEHYNQLLDNIINYFNPYVTVGVKERNIGIERQMKVSLVEVGSNSTFELEANAARLIRGDLSFKLETHSYSYLNKQDSNIIQKAETHIIEITNPISSETVIIEATQDEMF